MKSPYLILFLIGAILGPMGDGFHTYSGTTAYPSPVFLKMAWWVPFLFGVAVVVIGGSHPVFDRLLRRRSQALALGQVVLGLVFFLALYFASGFIKVSSPIMCVVLFGGMVLLWLAYDKTWQGIAVAVDTAVVGCCVEIALTHFQLFHYISPDIWGIPYWLPLLYMAASIAVGNLGRYLLLKDRN